MNNHISISKYLRSGFINKNPKEIAEAPLSALNGVSPKAEELLKTKWRINSIFELAVHHLFNNAFKIYASTSGEFDEFNRNGKVHPDLIDTAFQFKKPAELLDKPITALNGFTPENSKDLKEVLNFNTIRDLALWPPFIAAKEIIKVIYNPESVPGFDPEAPEDLIPKNGLNPTEIVYYNSLIMIPDLTVKVSSETDITAGRMKMEFSDGSLGFKRPMFGALLTFSQAWYTQGVTLGQLLYSLPLAPGESTKIAMIDWVRRTSTSSSEGISETDSLSNTTSQNRAIHEIAEATASEVQTGASMSSSASTSTEAGVAAGGLFGGVLAGGSASNASNLSVAGSYSVSAGLRNVQSDMMQNIAASTNQNAFSARNRRATLVTETNERENEQIKTRTVTNYNHMHAMTVQYYEVVQNYKAVTQLHRQARVIYIPFEPITFDNVAIIEQFRPILARFAKTNTLRLVLERVYFNINVEILAGFHWENTVIPPEPDKNLTAREYNVANGIRKAIAKTVMKEKMRLAMSFDNLRATSEIIADFNNETFSFTLKKGTRLINLIWNSQVAITKITIDTKADDIEISSKPSNFDTENISSAFVGRYPEGIYTNILSSINIYHPKIGESSPVHVKMKFIDENNKIRVLSLPLLLKKESDSTPILEFSATDQIEDISQLLNDDKLYYSQVIWKHADNNWLLMQLSKYRLGNKRIIDYIDPKAIKVVNNALVFLWNDDDANYTKWVSTNIDKGKYEEQIIAVPTGGVFAEAVLGRYNSAEKLDLTRFWNWQDSPIPIQAPDIAPIQSGDHDTIAAQLPGNLSQPIINITQPQSLPDPTGMQGVLQAITMGNMFRDMSGMAQTGQLAQAALNAAAQSASHASTQAGSNMATAGQFYTEIAKVAASMAPMLMGLPPVPSTGTSNISNAGASINHGAKMDAGSGGQAANPNPLLFNGQPANQNNNTQVPANSGGNNRPSNEKKAFDNTVNRTPEYTQPSEVKTSRGGARMFIFRLVFKEERGTPLDGIFSINIIPLNQAQRKKFDNQQPEMGGFLQLDDIELEDTDTKITFIVSGFLEVDGQSLQDLFSGQGLISLPSDTNVIDMSVALKFTQREVREESESKAIEKTMSETGFNASFKNLFSATLKIGRNNKEVSGSEGSEISGGGNVNNSESDESSTSTTTETTWIVRYPIPGLDIKQVI